MFISVFIATALFELTKKLCFLSFWQVCVHFPWRPNNALPSLSLSLCFPADRLLKSCLLWVNHTASHVRNHSFLGGLSGLISYLRTKS